MSNLVTEETEERSIIKATGELTIQTRTFLKRADGTILTELPWQERTIGPKDELKGESVKVQEHAKLARKHKTKELPPPQPEVSLGEEIPIAALTEPELTEREPTAMIFGKDIVPLAVLEAKAARGEELHPAEAKALAQHGVKPSKTGKSAK